MIKLISWGANVWEDYRTNGASLEATLMVLERISIEIEVSA